MLVFLAMQFPSAVASLPTSPPVVAETPSGGAAGHSAPVTRPLEEDRSLDAILAETAAFTQGLWTGVGVSALFATVIWVRWSRRSRRWPADVHCVGWNDP